MKRLIAAAVLLVVLSGVVAAQEQTSLVRELYAFIGQLAYENSAMRGVIGDLQKENDRLKKENEELKKSKP